MFHVELRSGLHVARAYNLNAEELQTRYLKPLRSGGLFVMEGHEWDPRKVRLLVYEAPQLRPDQIAMARGWPRIQKVGTDVTQQVLADTPDGPALTAERSTSVDRLKDRLIGRLSTGPVTLNQIVLMAEELMPDSSSDEHLAASHRAASELLHQGAASLAPPLPVS